MSDPNELIVLVPVERLEWEAAQFDARQERALKSQITDAILTQARNESIARERRPYGDMKIEVVHELEELELFPPEIRADPAAWVFIRARIPTKPIGRG